MKRILEICSKKMHFVLKRAFFPGFDLHTRCRYKNLPHMFQTGAINTLDAGCGNGSLSYAAHRLGNKVFGLELNANQVARNLEFFKRIGCKDMRFEVRNLYDLRSVEEKFDQIICSETLEHIARDAEVVRSLASLLKDGGVLHLCCPYALHPKHNLGRTNGPEDGGHVRDGYTLESYEALLMPAGFEIIDCVGLGSPLLNRADRVIRFVRNRAGDISALPLFLLFGWLAVSIDSKSSPKVPYSLYVKAIKKPAEL